jgi:hypothetical protein
VNLHYHDHPHHMTPEAVYRTFACDAAALGLPTLNLTVPIGGLPASQPSVRQP